MPGVHVYKNCPLSSCFGNLNKNTRWWFHKHFFLPRSQLVGGRKKEKERKTGVLTCMMAPCFDKNKGYHVNDAASKKQFILKCAHHCISFSTIAFQSRKKTYFQIVFQENTHRASQCCQKYSENILFVLSISLCAPGVRNIPSWWTVSALTFISKRYIWYFNKWGKEERSARPNNWLFGDYSFMEPSMCK